MEIETDSDDELPPEWEELTTKSGVIYYLDRLTRKKQLNHPRTGRCKKLPSELPHPWRKLISPENGQVTYVNPVDGRSTDIDPRLAFAVEEVYTSQQTRQRFDASSRSADVLSGCNLVGKTAAITGCSSGIGFEIANSLHLHGCHLVLFCRSADSCTETVAKLMKSSTNANQSIPDTVVCDLSDINEVLEAAMRVSERCEKIDFLFLNASTFGPPSRTGLNCSDAHDNLDVHFTVNYLAHFLLTHCLLPSLAKAEKATIVVTAAECYRFAYIAPDLSCLSASAIKSNSFTVSSDKVTSFRGHELPTELAFNRSQLFLILFVLEARRRWTDFRILAAHPGNLVNYPASLYRNSWFYRIIQFLVTPFAKSVSQAASSALYAAIAPELTSTDHCYINSCFPCELAVFDDCHLSQSDHDRTVVLAASLLWKSSMKILTDLLGSVNMERFPREPC